MTSRRRGLERIFIFRVCQYEGLDSHLTDEGRKGAKILALHLLNNLGVSRKSMAMFHSPVLCAKQMAGIMAYPFEVAFEQKACLFSDSSHPDVDEGILSDCLELVQEIKSERVFVRDLIFVTHYHQVGELPQYLVRTMFDEPAESRVLDRGEGWLVNLVRRPRLLQISPQVPARRIRTARVPA